ncbi:MAG TPA: hypothetical protein VEA44_08115 [Caulobacter sp.]|nr:hypothetical protein [Caulobacter sp.]
MAIANTKSTAITNRDASPRVPSPAHLVRGPLFEAVGTVEIAATDDDGSVYRMARLRSSDRVSQLTVFNDAITGGTGFDLGLYRTADEGGAAVDDDLFASAISLASASATGTDITFESGATDVAKIEKRIWELLGLSADPQVDYDLAFTGDTVGTAAGTVSLRVRFTGGY